MRFIAVVEKRRAALVLIALFLVLFGARAALLGYAANSTRFLANGTATGFCF